MILSRVIMAPIISFYHLAFATILPVSRPLCLVRAFSNSGVSHHAITNQARHYHGLFSSSGNDSNNEYNVKAASVKLVWETLEESSSRPILDLSSRDASPEDITEENSNEDEWAMGQKWQETKKALTELGVLSNESDEKKFLDTCPQLLRLDTELIVETAEWIVLEFGADYFAKQPTSPKLLSYRLADAQYGIEFMSMMMMMNDAKPVCQNSADFFVTAIDGGIQERSVSNALGAASAATYQANQKVAGDAMSSLQSLKNRKKGL